MSLRIGQMLLDPGYFALECLDPLIEFIDRQRAEVLLDEQGQRVLRLAGKEVILVHGGIVDPPRPQVNKLAPGRGCGGVDE